MGQQGAAYIKYDEVEEDKEDVHHDPHDELQLADDPPGILQCVRQVLALLVYLDMQQESCCVVCGLRCVVCGLRCVVCGLCNPLE